jgi:hypothetical protein
MPHPYLQPMAAGEIVLNALRVYRDHVRLLVLVSLFPHLALLGLELLVMPGGASTGAFVLVLLVTVVMNGVALTAITVAIGRITLGEEPGVGETYRQTFRANLPAVVMAYLITAVLVSVGLMLLVVPGILLGALFAPTIPLIVVERRGVIEGLVGSVRLMKGQLSKGIVAFTFFILVAGFLPLLLLLAQGAATMGPLTPLLSAIVGSATLPLGFAANVMLYFSLRATDSAGAEQLEAQLKAPLAE